jgi:thiosulfate reductase cytochrome b subunit
MTDEPQPETEAAPEPAPVAEAEEAPAATEAAPPESEPASRTGLPGEATGRSESPKERDRQTGPGREESDKPAPPAKRPLVKRHHGIVRLAHWLNAVLLAGMIASGLQIYLAFPNFGPRGGPYLPNPIAGKPIPGWALLGGWLAGGLNWHFALAWPFVITGLVYLVYMAISGEWRSLLFRPRDVPRALQMQLYYLRLRREHPPQGKHNALQKGAYTFILFLGAVSVLSGFAIYKESAFPWLSALFGGYELARYWHFWAVWIFIAFTIVHVLLVLLVDPASLRAMITGWYRGRFPSHD